MAKSLDGMHELDANGGYWTQKNNNFIVRPGGEAMPPSFRNVWIGPGGTEWNSTAEYLKSAGNGGSSAGGFNSQTSAPGGSAAYAAPATVDRTNVYENRLLGLLDNPDSIANTGAYKFRFNQGQQALERSAAAKSMSGSGNTLAALLEYGQGQAAQAYNTEADRLGNLSGGQKNYILGLLGDANTTAAAANNFNLGNQRNAIEWNLGAERNSIARMAAENAALPSGRSSRGSSEAAPFQAMGGFTGDTPLWHQEASRNFFNRDDRAIAAAY